MVRGSVVLTTNEKNYTLHAIGNGVGAEIQNNHVIEMPCHGMLYSVNRAVLKEEVQKTVNSQAEQRAKLNH